MNENLSYIESAFRRFEENEKHITRVYNQNVLVLVLFGRLKFTENGEDVELSSGEFYIQRKNLFQEGKTASDTPEYFFIHFKGEYEDIKKDIPLRGFFEKEALLPLLEAMAEPLISTYKKQALFFEVLDRLSQHITEDSLEFKLKNYIDIHYSEDIGVHNLAEHFSYSARYLEKLFKDAFNISIHKYIVKKRIEKAKFALRTSNQSIEGIAYSCGYTEFSTFYRNFTAIEKMSPLKWKKLQISG